MSITKLMTAEELFAFDPDARYELIDGVLREMPSPGAHSSGTGAMVTLLVGPFVLKHRLGSITGADGGYVLRRDPDIVHYPDVGFIRSDRLPGGRLPDGLVPVPPDLAVEIMSPSDRLIDAERKAQRYLDAGTTLVWIVKPRSQSAVSYRADRAPIEIPPDGVLDGEDVLPGFTLLLADVFAGLG